MIKRLPNYIGAVVALLLVSGLLLVLIAAGVSFIQSFSINAVKAADWTEEHAVQANFTVKTILNVYYILSGILFFGFFFLMEQRLVATGVPRKQVLRRTLFTLGIELLILALIQLAMLAFASILPLQVGLIAIEIALGAGLIYLGRRKDRISLERRRVHGSS